MTNSSQTTLYIGVTNNLARRVYEHKHKLVEGFTKRYNLTKLVYFEMFESITQAIEREKQLKAGSRKKKVDLINTLNENWNDLYDSILE
jgi:putative endonuclease